MLRKLVVAIAVFMIGLSCAFAQGTAKSKGVLNTEVGTNFPNNTTGFITPALAASAFNDFIASWQQAPVTNAQTGTSYSVAIGDYGSLITLNNASPIAVTLPTPTGQFATMNTFMKNIGAGTATISATGSTIDGSPSVTIVSGSYRWFISDGSGSNYVSVQNGSTPTANSIIPSMLASQSIPYGSPMVNCTVQATVAANALTISILTRNGTAPTSGDPCWITNAFFQSNTGNYSPVEITSALTVTVPSGATLGTVNGQANRIWVGAFNNAGTVTLAVYNSLSGTNVLSWDETSTAAVTAITAGSTNAQTWYGSAQTTNFRIIGYVESTQATAGTWASSPSKVQLFGPGQRKPGDIVQNIVSAASSSPTTSSASFVVLTGINVVITPTSAANLIKVNVTGSGSQNGTGNWGVQVSRGTTNNTNMIGSINGPNAQSGFQIPVGVFAYDTPNTTSSTTYAVQGRISGGLTLTWNPNSNTSIVEATEIFQ